MRKVTNTQRHVVTPAGDVPAIPAHGQATIDEKLPENAALIEDGILAVVESGRRKAQDKETSE